MLKEAMAKFLVMIPDLLDGLCDNSRMYEAEIYDGDYVLIPYALKKPLRMEEIKALVEEKEEMRVMYFARNKKGRESLCVYSDPCLQCMFKLNAMTDNSGYVFDVNVTVYDSLEIMSRDLVVDLNLIDSSDLVYRKETGEFIADFS